MIYILVGNGIKAKSLHIKELTINHESFLINDSDLDKDLIMNYANNVSLFNDSPVVILEEVLNEGVIAFSSEELNSLKESKTLFIFKEDKMSALNQKKYKKYGEIKVFEEKKITSKENFNIFNIADAFASRDKILAWTLFHKGMNQGVEPEAIAGVLFWKIKTMILSSSRIFNKDELKHQSSGIVSLYHKAHRGECDFSISLEQFILSSLSSR
jgi:DNA polymerase III delta subunit